MKFSNAISVSIFLYLLCCTSYVHAAKRAFVFNNGTVEYKLDKDNLTIARIVETVSQDAQTFKILSTIQATGIATLFQKSPIERKSVGVKTKNGPHTQRYEEIKNNKSSVAQWNAETQRYTFEPPDPHDSLPATEPVLDRLSLAYVFSLGKSLTSELDVVVTNGKRLDQYHYRKTETVTLSTPLGKIETIHFVRQIVGDDNQVEFWVAPSFSYLPIRIRVQDGKNGVLDQTIEKIQSASP